jgi:hypothetical protein
MKETEQKKPAKRIEMKQREMKEAKQERRNSLIRPLIGSIGVNRR